MHTHRRGAFLIPNRIFTTQRHGRAAWCAAVCVAAICHASDARAQTFKPKQVWAAGTDNAVWVAAAAPLEGSTLPLVRMWQADRAADQSTPRQSLNLPAVTGDPLFVTADSDALRIMFTNLTACEYHASRPYSPGPDWTDTARSRPLAWAGDATQPILWAVVATDDLQPRPTTSNAGSAAEDDAEDAAQSTTYTLLQHRNGVWRRIPIPKSIGMSRTCWIASRQAIPTLFWQRDGRVFDARIETDTWTAPRQLPIDSPVHGAWAGAARDGVVFIAGLKESASRVELHLFQDNSGQWKHLGAAREGNDLLTVIPDSVGVAVARGAVVVARPAAEGGVEFGAAALDPDPALRFTTLPLASDTLTTRNKWEDGLLVGIMLGLMTVALMWRRLDAVTPLPLPAGLACAAIWKRALAALIDFIPAALAVMPWLYPKMMTLTQGNLIMFSPEQNALWAEQTQSEQYAMLLCFGAWGALWEALLGRTPGKMVLAIRVMSLDGKAPSAGQAIARNLVRMLMVALGQWGLLGTFLTMTILTRNRQRIGDLLARTIVVEPAMTPDIQRDAQPPDSANPFD